MKNLKTIAIALVLTLGTITTKAQDKKINTSKSQVEWVGKKVTGEHSGVISFKEGVLNFKSGKLTGGSFTVDMTSIEVTDLKAGEGKEKLEGHLKATDFFGTDAHKEATLVFTSVKATGGNKYAVIANLTIKGITKPVTFDLTVAKNSATTEFKVDRTKYGIEYNSGSIFDGLGDKVIYDDFELTVNLQF
ncbi:YceI family protein [Flavobacterium arcticum]|uniref:YceI family protein n=1 Tax=Flavobacterium arcticum TaxID=1784713 RepID=A0A345HE75_9FLAO|nr:YceI family protein [Flavobacterium arcticum]AXG74885.1 YceI family protein [Flavobacterium arcticum]KAF2509617.1 YceI family protein [Flavobacterium arcticum]